MKTNSDSSMPRLYDATGRLIATPVADMDSSPKNFLERMAREGQSLAGADLVRFLNEWEGGPHVLNNANLDGIDLRGCRANKVSFKGASLIRAMLSNGSFREAEFDHACLDGVIADGANFFRASLYGCLFREVVRPAHEPQRHPLRPIHDEWVPFDRAILRSAEFSRADMRDIVAVNADFSYSDFEKTDLTSAALERCFFTGVYWTGARLDEVVAYYCILPSTTLHLVTAHKAVFRSNSYTVEPGVREILDSNFRLPAQIKHYLRETWLQRQAMPKEIRSDAERTLLIRFFVMLLVPILVALSWRKVETAPGISAFLAFGAISTFAFRRYLTMTLQATIVAILVRMHNAHGAIMTGHPIKAFSILFLPGYVTEKLGVAPSRRKQKKPKPSGEG